MNDYVGKLRTSEEMSQELTNLGYPFEKLIPPLTRSAGQNRVGAGVNLTIQLAIYDARLEPFENMMVQLGIEDIIKAVAADEQLQTSAMTAYNETIKAMNEAK